MIMIKVYNTLSRRKENFEPLHENRVKIFVCGPTVYEDSHIGHARTYISFDAIARYLKYCGFSVFYLQNITDIDDKIIKRAAEVGLEPLVIARKFEKSYMEDMKVLGVDTVNFYARASEHITEIIKQIKTLIKKDFAYETSNGVYFDESQFEDFGKLSKRNIKELNVHRIDLDTMKKNPGDFALWKKNDEKPFWDSPWGKGRPGWHIEDTAITNDYLGPQYDIHGGGLDLIFPHHEAEIAQMESVSGVKPMVRYWMHTGFLNVKGEKMSKSEGNFITIKELLEEYSPDVFRFFVLSTHYRSPIDFNHEILNQSQKSLNRVYKIIETFNFLLENNIPETGSNDKSQFRLLQKTRKKFFEAMNNDFNIPLALSYVFNLIREVNRDLNEMKISKNSLNAIKNFITESGIILGFDFTFEKVQNDLEEDLIKILIKIRDKLRQKKDWELADEIRSNLRDLDIILEDK
jgi:cysteinyl-tRNA synthetase